MSTAILGTLLVKNVQSDGVVQPPEVYINFKGDGVVVADNPSNNSTDVTIGGGVGVLSNGTPVVAEPNLNFIRMVVFQDSPNSANAVLAIPIVLPVTNSAAGTLDNQHTLGEVQTGTGACVVNLDNTGVFGGSQVTICDIDGQANINNVTVNALGGVQIEDPANAGSYSSSITISVNSFTVVWGLSSSTSKWKVVSCFPPGSF